MAGRICCAHRYSQALPSGTATSCDGWHFQRPNLAQLCAITSPMRKVRGPPKSPSYMCGWQWGQFCMPALGDCPYLNRPMGKSSYNAHCILKHLSSGKRTGAQTTFAMLGLSVGSKGPAWFKTSAWNATHIHRHENVCLISPLTDCALVPKVQCHDF